MSKVMDWIATHYEGWKLSGHTIWMIAEECQVAPSTVYRAVNKLKNMGALNADKEYVGRPYIPPKEIATFARNGTILLTEKKYSEIKAATFAADNGAIWSGVRWGLMGGQFIQRNGGSYGYLIEISANAQWEAT